MDNKIKIVTTSNYVSVNWMPPKDRILRGAISADLVDPEKKIWWINRAIIKPENYRNQGIGSLLLKKLIDIIRDLDGSIISVCPGGYDQNIDKQYNFYLKNGFIFDINNQNESLIYTLKR